MGRPRAPSRARHDRRRGSAGSFPASWRGWRASVEGESDLDVHTGREMVEALERIDRLRGGLMDVDQALVRPDLEVLLGVLVLERGLDDGVDVLLRGERHGA